LSPGANRLPVILWVGAALLAAAHIEHPYVRSGLGWSLDVAGFSPSGFLLSLLSVAACAAAALAVVAFLAVAGLAVRRWASFGSAGGTLGFEATTAGLIAGSLALLGLGLNGLLYGWLLTLIALAVLMIGLKSQVSGLKLLGLSNLRLQT